MSSPSAYDQYHVLRLVPDLATGEFINVGVLVLSRSQGAVVARVPETPEAFGKVPVAHRRTFAASLDQFFCLLRSVDGFHPLASGLHEGEYRDETDARLLDYMTGVASPLALSEGRRCNATAPHEIAEMLYGSLVKPPCVTAARHSRIDYDVRQRLTAADLYGPEKVHWNARLRTPIGEHRVKMGYGSVKGQLVLSPVNFGSRQSHAEANQAYTSADLVHAFSHGNGFETHAIAAFRLNGHDGLPPGFSLLAAKYGTFIDLGSTTPYALANPVAGGPDLAVVEGPRLEEVVADRLDRIFVPASLGLET